MYAKGDFTMLRKLFLLLVLFSSVVGCSRSPSYKGYVPVTQEEAIAFAEQLVERTSQGDVSWYLEIPEDPEATAAIFAIAGLDIPAGFRNITDEDRATLKKNKVLFHPNGSDLRELKFKEVKKQFNTYIAVFEFTREVGDGTTSKMATTVNHIVLLKRRDTGKIVMAGLGTKI
jgi:hypothetical protein